MTKPINQDVVQHQQSRNDLADEALALASKLEALCAVQVLLVTEGLSVAGKYQHAFARVLEDHAMQLRQVLSDLLD